MSFSSSDDVLAWMAGAANFERVGALPGGFRLDRMRAIVAALGHPDRAWRAIHVAGTKGKGTTCAAAASILDALSPAGRERRVGLYTSPHLIDPRERIRLGPSPAPDALWVEAGGALAAAVARAAPPVGRDDGPTWFELCTALAFELFRRAGVEVAVLEVGLGGRLDATNVITPAVSVVTRIGRDHTAILGRSLAAIAAEKAGIVKPGVPVVAGPEEPEAVAVVRERASAAAAPLLLLGKGLRVEVLGETGDAIRPGIVARITTPRATYAVPRAPVAAAVAADLALAVAAVEALVSPTAPLDPEAVARGLGRLRWRGRWDVAAAPSTTAGASSCAGLVVVDGAHDGSSFRALRATAAVRLGTTPGAAPVLLLGVSRDKELEEIADALAGWAGLEVVTCAAKSPRATDPAELARLVAARGLPVVVARDAADGLATALARAAPRGAAVLVAGSLILAGDVLALLGQDVRDAWSPT